MFEENTRRCLKPEDVPKRPDAGNERRDLQPALTRPHSQRKQRKRYRGKRERKRLARKQKLSVICSKCQRAHPEEAACIAMLAANYE